MEIYDEYKYYGIILYCLYIKENKTVKKIKILNKYLLINVGEREYRYWFEEEYIMPGLIYVIYLPLPDDVKDILRWGVRNGLIYVEIRKSF